MTIEGEQCAMSASATDPDQYLETDPTVTAIEAAIGQAAYYASMGHTLAAEQAYAQADHLLGSERSARHAEVLVSLAMIVRKRGDLVQATSHLDMALAMCTNHRVALSIRLALAEDQKDLAMAAALRVKMVDLCESEEAQVHVLSAVVDDALSAAVAAALRAVELRPGDNALKLRLRGLLDAV